MKQLLITSAAVLAAVNIHAQGTVNFANAAAGGLFQPVTSGVDGSKVAPGNAYRAQLYYANGASASESQLEAVGAAVPFSSNAGQEGLFFGGARTLPNIDPPGGVGTFQVRAWSAVLGDNGTDAESSWQGQGPDASRLFGRSALFTVDTANPMEVPTPTPVAMLNFRAFSVVMVPEPSAIALAALGGLSALVLFRRRK
jgi:hypothetical protein